MRLKDMSILPKITPRNDDVQREAEVDRQLIRFESQFGRNLFGPVPKDHNRDFFCLDENTWIWHEDWKDAKGQPVVQSTRYVLRPSGAVKSINGHSYQSLSQEESENLYLAIKKYVSLAQNNYSNLLQS